MHSTPVAVRAMQASAYVLAVPCIFQLAHLTGIQVNGLVQPFQSSSSRANVAETVDYVLNGTREREQQREQKSKGREGEVGHFQQCHLEIVLFIRLGLHMKFLDLQTSGKL